MGREVEFSWSLKGPPPDRTYLEDTLLPDLATRGSAMLFVGVADYTGHYDRLVGSGVRFVTTDASLDIDEHGKPEFIFNISDPNFSHQLRQALAANREDIVYFDSIVLNGIFGWGTNTEPAIEQSLHNAYHLLRPGGALLLGWNSPEYPTKINLSDERLLEMVRATNFLVNTIEGDEIFTGPQTKKWSPQMHSEYQFHRYVLAEKPRSPVHWKKKNR